MTEQHNIHPLLETNDLMFPTARPYGCTPRSPDAYDIFLELHPTHPFFHTFYSHVKNTKSHFSNTFFYNTTAGITGFFIRAI
jgi:hypothetical protein